MRSAGRVSLSLLMIVTAVCAVSVAVDVTSIHHSLDTQAAALKQIAENTKAPVAIKLDGFSPEAQTALATALTPERSKPKVIKK